MQTECRKRKYGSRAAAEAVLKKIRESVSKRFKHWKLKRSYKCNDCGCWHLTSFETWRRPTMELNEFMQVTKLRVEICPCDAVAEKIYYAHFVPNTEIHEATHNAGLVGYGDTMFEAVNCLIQNTWGKVLVVNPGTEHRRELDKLHIQLVK